MTMDREDFMLTLAYCRVSTEEQAEEGFSIEGQAERLRLYAQLRDLGDVTVVTDPGKSGKNLERPGLQQVLAVVEAGHVSHVLVWRLDRLSRNLADLILLADLLGEHGVALHSVTENLDLSSATGRMFYNILGTFAQYFREQLSKNVRMGTQRAAKEGKWMNRPKTGYDLVDKHLVINGDAPRVQEVFRLRAEGLSYPKIETATGIKYSTARAIIQFTHLPWRGPPRRDLVCGPTRRHRDRERMARCEPPHLYRHPAFEGRVVRARPLRTVWPPDGGRPERPGSTALSLLSPWRGLRSARSLQRRLATGHAPGAAPDPRR